MKTTWAGEPYNGDKFPKHFTAEQIKDYTKKYLNIREEFYSVTKNLVVTPEKLPRMVQCPQTHHYLVFAGTILRVR